MCEGDQRDAARCAASHWLANVLCEELNQELRRSPEIPATQSTPTTTTTTRLVFGFPLAVRPAVHLSPFAIRRSQQGGEEEGGTVGGGGGQLEEQRETKSFQTHAGRKLFSLDSHMDGEQRRP